MGQYFQFDILFDLSEKTLGYNFFIFFIETFYLTLNGRTVKRILLFEFMMIHHDLYRRTH